MKKHFLILSCLAAVASAISVDASAQSEEPVTLTLFDTAVFYDGYQSVVQDADLKDGILRHNNHQYARYLTPAELDKIGDNLSLDVYVNARCDNYDRMGRVSLAWLPKRYALPDAQTRAEGVADTNPYDGQAVPYSYDYDEATRIELGRFITPFMNLNRLPNQVPYHYDIPEVALILRNPQMREAYDFWLETEIFGVPYSANTQIRGCADRQDVFAATVTLTSTPFTQQEFADKTSLFPIYHTISELHGGVNFNNYNEKACDEVGKAARTFNFTVDKPYADSKLTLIMTNHGAQENGEEYERRVHFVYLDGKLILTYTPGGVSCEPYRQYNTQGNYIYTMTPMDDEYWAEWNNWCPGQAVPIREIHLGQLAAGEHSVYISVPDAVFYGSDGDFRPSLYVQALEEGELPNVAVETIEADGGVSSSTISGSWSNEGGVYRFVTDAKLTDIRVYSLDGTLLYGSVHPENGIDLSGLGLDIQSPILLMVIDEAGRIATLKLSR